jgi:4-diphosphocytidyl-2-C-methyl-D-erythritol kinase
VTEVVTEPARAKINPFLRVLERRDDGYHEIETLILQVTLADGVQAVPADDLRLTVVGERAAQVPAGEDNLVLRAVRALQALVGHSSGAHLLLSKRIPVAAGLGGGSADAAATLRALDRLWCCGLGIEGLIPVAAEVGSDVPALLFDGPVIARGRGEIVERVRLARTWWVLLTSEEGIRTEETYERWDATGVPGKATVKDLISLLARREFDRIGPLLANDLESSVAEHRTDVGGAKSRLLAQGALGAVMSGSGPTVAGLARDGAHAEKLAKAVGGMVVASVGR